MLDRVSSLQEDLVKGYFYLLCITIKIMKIHHEIKNAVNFNENVIERKIY